MGNFFINRVAEILYFRKKGEKEGGRDTLGRKEREKKGRSTRGRLGI